MCGVFEMPAIPYMEKCGDAVKLVLFSSENYCVLRIVVLKSCTKRPKILAILKGI